MRFVSVCRAQYVRVWFLQVTILIFKYTGEVYCMTESFLTVKPIFASHSRVNVSVILHFHETWCIIIFISHWSAIDFSFIDQYYPDNRIFLSWLIINDFMLQNRKFSDRSLTEHYGCNSCSCQGQLFCVQKGHNLGQIEDKWAKNLDKLECRDFLLEVTSKI
jgi:hypothetical protein